MHILVLFGVLATAIGTVGEDRWTGLWLLLLLALSVGSELAAVWLKDGTIYVSGSFLGIVVCAVLLGGGPAAIVGIVTIAVGWLRSRETPAKLLHNLAAYGAFPLIAGLVFHALMHATGVGRDQGFYYVLVFGIFLLALLLNFTMAASYVSFVNGVSLIGNADWMKQLVVPELFAALFTLAATYLTNHDGVTGLLMVALVIALFQYLVSQLLSAQMRAEELHRMATTDELTGLPNRRHFGDLLSAEIERRGAEGQSLAVLLLDLDHFSDVNDTLGHDYGDQLLEQLAPRLAEHCAEGGPLARLGGDEFAWLALLPDDDTVLLDAMIADLLARVREPITVGEVTMAVNASVGVARFPRDGRDARALLRSADVALHVAKGQRDGHRFYVADQDHHSAQRLSLLGEFSRALESGDQIVLLYHPIVDLRSGRLHGAEALVRWHHPQLGLLAPGAFLQTVERTELITALTSVVLEQALADCGSWQAEGEELTVSVNLSVRNLQDPELPGIVADALAKHDVAPHRLTLEITESMIMSDPDRATATTQALRELGVRLSVDDFGTGHASLATLQLLPADELKIDRSFVSPMLQESSDMVIVRSTVALGHALGLRVVAEGVEDEATLDALRNTGCDGAQGYHLSEPITADAFTEWARVFATREL